MNISSLTGLAAAFLVLWYGVIHPSSNPKLFLDAHALILVCGGTLAAALIAFPIQRIFTMSKFIVFGVIFKRKKSDLKIAQQILETYHQMQMGRASFQMNFNYHPFLCEGVSMIGKRKFNEADLTKVLQSRINYMKKTYQADAKLLNALAKFPPAFGLLGASTGMISMMTNLGKGGADQIGPSMAVALVATFWGIAVANFIFLPLADYANKISVEETHTRTMIKDAVLCMIKRGSISQMSEVVSGYLSIDQRRILRSYVKENLINIKSYETNSQRNLTRPSEETVIVKRAV